MDYIEPINQSSKAQATQRLRGKTGFTLLEMTVVLLIIGVVTAAGIALFSTSMKNRYFKETQFKLDAIQEALQHYRNSFNRLPCPADVTMATGNVNFGVSASAFGDCYSAGDIRANFNSGNVVQGMVPFQTLRLPDDYAFDGWGNRIMYTVDKRYTDIDAFITYDFGSEGDIIIEGLIPTPATESATFLKHDKVTQGSWVGMYGSEGYNVISDDEDYPAYAEVSLSGSHTEADWDASTDDVRALQKATDNDDRIAARWHTASSLNSTFTIDVDMTDSSDPHTVTLYIVDWDSEERMQKIDVLDSSNNVLDTRYMTTSYNGGVYMSWTAWGHVKFKVTNLNGSSNAVVSGIFFDPYVGGLPAVYSVMSYGENSYGAWPRGSATTAWNLSANRLSSNYVTNTNDDEAQNCNCLQTGDSSTFTQTFNSIFVQKSYSKDPTDNNNTFDDMVVNGTRSSMKMPNE